MEVTEGTPDLGVTSYWTDEEGNVVFGSNTPKEKMKTTLTGTKMQKRKGEEFEHWQNYRMVQFSHDGLKCLLINISLQNLFQRHRL